MAKGANYRVPYRRRREKKTDYKARRILATSEFPRIVVRVSNKEIIVQVTKSKIEGDFVLANASSYELRQKFGWKASGKNIPENFLSTIIDPKLQISVSSTTSITIKGKSCTSYGAEFILPAY